MPPGNIQYYYIRIWVLHFTLKRGHRIETINRNKKWPDWGSNTSHSVWHAFDFTRMPTLLQMTDGEVNLGVSQERSGKREVGVDDWCRMGIISVNRNNNTYTYFYLFRLISICKHKYLLRIKCGCYYCQDNETLQAQYEIKATIERRILIQ